METHGMCNTQVSVWEIQYPNTPCQYQDTVEMQETLLVTTMDASSAQGTRTMIILVAAVHSKLKVAGGIIVASSQTSTVSTTVGHTPPMLMV